MRHCVRLVDSSPAANVHRSDGIRRASEPAGYAAEVVSCGTVCFVDGAALRAGPGGVLRIDEDNRNPCQSGLVLDKLPELMERPAMVGAPLSLSNRYPITDALQIFKSDTAPGAFGLRNQPFADHMVHVCGEPRFLVSPLLQEPLRRLGALLLKPCPQLRVTLPQAVDLSTRVCFAIGVGSEVHDAEVNAKKVRRIDG